MNRDDIIRMATEVWGTPKWTEIQISRLERFFNMAQAAQREMYIKQYLILENERDEILKAVYAMLGSIPPYTEEGEPTIPDAVIEKVNAAIAKVEGNKKWWME